MKNSVDCFRRIFAVRDGGEIIDCALTALGTAERMCSIVRTDGVRRPGEPYIPPERRSADAGSELFRFVGDAVRREGAPYLLLSTAIKDRRAVPHFYIDEMGMEFRSAGLLGKLSPDA